MDDTQLNARLGVPAGPFAGVIFDCDGTLADSMPAHYEAWLEAFAAVDFRCGFPEAQFYSFGGVPTRAIVQRLNAQHGTAMDPEAVFHAKEEAFLRLTDKIKPIVPVIDFARGCRRAGIPIAVASGGPRPVVTSTLAHVGLAGLFDAVVTQDDIVHGKPAPDIFLEAARRLGVDPKRCLVFEDAEPGRQAGLAAGMQVVMVDARKLL